MLLHNVYLLDLKLRSWCIKIVWVFVCTSKYKAVIMYKWNVVVWTVNDSMKVFFVYHVQTYRYKMYRYYMFSVWQQLYFNILILSQRLVHIPYMYMQYFLKPKIHLHVFLHYFWKCVILIIRSMIIVRIFNIKERYWVHTCMYICQNFTVP